MDIGKIISIINCYAQYKNAPPVSEDDCYEIYYALRDLTGSDASAMAFLSYISSSPGRGYKKLLTLKPILV